MLGLIVSAFLLTTRDRTLAEEEADRTLMIWLAVAVAATVVLGLTTPLHPAGIGLAILAVWVVRFVVLARRS